MVDLEQRDRHRGDRDRLAIAEADPAMHMRHIFGHPVEATDISSCRAIATPPSAGRQPPGESCEIKFNASGQR